MASHGPSQSLVQSSDNPSDKALELLIDELGDVTKTLRRIKDHGLATWRSSMAAPDALGSLRETLSQVSRLYNEVVHPSFSSTISIIGQQSNVYTRAARLPEELLSEVFMYSTQPLPDKRPERQLCTELRTRILLVCKHWRHVAENTAKLWNHISLTETNRMIQRYILLSRNLPLRIDWKISHLNNDPASHVLIHHIQNVKELNIAMENDDERVGVYHLGYDLAGWFHQVWQRCSEKPAVQLESLSIWDHGEDGSQLRIDTLNTPRLKTLNLFRGALDAPLPTSLQRFASNSGSPAVTCRDVLSVLAACPELTSCAFTDHFGWPLNENTDTNINPQALVISSLRELILDSFIKPDILWLLDRISLPSLEKLVIVALARQYEEIDMLSSHELEVYRARATSLRISPQALTYSDGSFLHSVSFQVLPRMDSDEDRSTIPYPMLPCVSRFVSLERLLIQRYLPRAQPQWLDVFSTLPHLIFLGVTISDSPSELLLALNRDQCSLLPHLKYFHLEVESVYGSYSSYELDSDAPRREDLTEMVVEFSRIRHSNGKALQVSCPRSDWWPPDMSNSHSEEAKPSNFTIVDEIEWCRDSDWVKRGLW
ncbi:hypothetical protein SISSUDRAFT_477722 [Sistotremastrum suecicum HHB10207 ss-3]|uniref:F-box domain-containing protein n=1 Tax=Sistotremastrum suecicum HHB10207 ss-3 TaxID=1314776 RepID=A0A166FBE8_9AGAM|nr:hypothetical protein SISSUDRAFT_477722 [Sistotremastrum suecicum HHB10207 ss-3]